MPSSSNPMSFNSQPQVHRVSQLDVQRAMYEELQQQQNSAQSQQQDRWQQGRPSMTSFPDMRSTTSDLRLHQPPSNQIPGLDMDKERLKAQADELQGVVDRQTLEIRRRNEELLELQRNHEAFREKFILFREGVRSKTDETDARCRKLEAQLRASKDELANRRAQLEEGRSENGFHRLDGLRSVVRDLERKADALSTEKKDLEAKLASIRSGNQSDIQNEIHAKETMISDFRTRVEKQAEFIRFQTAKVAELEQHLEQLREAPEPSSLQSESDYRERELEAAISHNARSLEMQKSKIADLRSILEDERRKAEQLRESVREAEEQRNSLQRDFDSKFEQLESLKMEQQQKALQLSIAKRNVQDLQIMLQDTNARKSGHDLQQTLHESQIELSAEKSKFDTLNAELLDRKRVIQQLESKVRQVNLDLEHQQQASDHESQVLQTYCSALEMELQALHQQHRETQQQIGNYEGNMKSYYDLQISESKRHEKQLEDEKDQLNKAVMVVERDIEIMKSSLRQKQEMMSSQHSADGARMMDRIQQAGRSADDMDRQIMNMRQEVSDLEARFQQQCAIAGGGAAGGGAAGGAGGQQAPNRERLIRWRDILLNKLIGNGQKQTLGKSFAAWLRSIEAYKMDRILMESDKYMSMDSSIDDLLMDALSKRRARSIVTSSVGGSSIDDETFQASANTRPVSGGSVVSYGGSSMSGSLEWMV